MSEKQSLYISSCNTYLIKGILKKGHQKIYILAGKLYNLRKNTFLCNTEHIKLLYNNEYF